MMMTAGTEGKTTPPAIETAGVSGPSLQEKRYLPYSSLSDASVDKMERSHSYLMEKWSLLRASLQPCREVEAPVVDGYEDAAVPPAVGVYQSCAAMSRSCTGFPASYGYSRIGSIPPPAHSDVRHGYGAGLEKCTIPPRQPCPKVEVDKCQQ